jgi:hypothetical protein
MAQYRIIVAPKASGQSNNLEWKNANSQGPANSATLSEGRKSTLAMINAGNSTVYPAAWFCYNLNIAGRTDWYLPARDELALAFRSFRPQLIDAAPNYSYNLVTDAGDGITWRGQGFVFDYKTFGSPGDISIYQGVNVNSSPAAAAYTDTVPDQTSIVAFYADGAEAFDYEYISYWTSSDYAYDSAGIYYTKAWKISFDTGEELPVNKNNYDNDRVRAVRRSII